MAKVQFLGRVLPEILRITVPPVDIGWNERADSERGIIIDTTFKIRINLSIINIECEAKSNHPDEVNILAIRAQDLARAAVNILAFKRAAGLSVIFDFCIQENGIPAPIVPQDPMLSTTCTAFEETDGATISALFKMVVTEEPVHRALNDLITAITLPHVSPQSCARAMDGLKHHIAGSGLKEPAMWETMRKVLNIDMDFLKYITEASKGPRHAKPGQTPGSVTTEVTARSWAIMNRYFEYRKRNSQPLTEPDFPLLKNLT